MFALGQHAPRTEYDWLDSPITHLPPKPSAELPYEAHCSTDPNYSHLCPAPKSQEPLQQTNHMWLSPTWPDQSFTASITPTPPPPQKPSPADLPQAAQATMNPIRQTPYCDPPLSLLIFLKIPIPQPTSRVWPSGLRNLANVMTNNNPTPQVQVSSEKQK